MNCSIIWELVSTQSPTLSVLPSSLAPTVHIHEQIILGVFAIDIYSIWLAGDRNHFTLCLSCSCLIVYDELFRKAIHTADWWMVCRNICCCITEGNRRSYGYVREYKTANLLLLFPSPYNGIIVSQIRDYSWNENLSDKIHLIRYGCVWDYHTQFP